MLYPGLSRPVPRKPVQQTNNFLDVSNQVIEESRIPRPNPIDELLPGPSLRITSTPGPRAGPSYGPLLESLYVSSTPRNANPKTPGTKAPLAGPPATPGPSRNMACNAPLATPRVFIPKTPSAVNISESGVPMSRVVSASIPRTKEPETIRNRPPLLSTSSDVSALEAVAHQFTDSDLNLPKLMAEATIFIGVLLLKWSSKVTHPQRILNLLKIVLVLGFIGLHPIYAALTVICLSSVYAYYKLAHLTKRLK